MEIIIGLFILIVVGKYGICMYSVLKDYIKASE